MPILPWAVALWVGIGFTLGIGPVPVGLAVSWVALGLARGRFLGSWLVLCAMGWMIGTLDHSRRALAWQGFEAQKPVELVVRAISHPERGVEGEVKLWAESQHWRQRLRVGVGKRRLRLTLPAEVEPPRHGELLRVRGYLRTSAGYWNGTPIPPPRWSMWVESPRLVSRERQLGPAFSAVAWLRSRASTPWDEVSSPGVALARALLLGDRSQISESWQRGLRRAGLQHLLAVSGLHVGLVAIGLATLVGRKRRRWRYLLAALGVLIYLLLVGPRPSVQRAALMGLLVLAAKLCRRPPAIVNTLALVAASLVVLEPPLINDLGFRLSVLATAGILSFGRILTRRWQTTLPKPLASGLAASTAAQLATWPLTVPLSGGVVLGGWLLNLVAVPWLALFLVVAMLWWLLALAGVPGAELLTGLLNWLTWPIEALTQPPAAWFGRLTLPPSSGLAITLALYTGGVLLASPKLRQALLLAGLSIGLTGGVAGQAPIAVPSLTLLDVGQGDALLLRDGRRAVLVDGGGWRRGDFGGRVLVPALAAAGIGKLDAIVLTHPDLDHCHGLRDLTSYLPVAEVWMSPGWSRSSCATSLATLAGSHWRPLWRGDRLRVGRWRLTVIHPPPSQRGGKSNDRSLVLLAAAHGRRVLLTGDLEAGGEARLLRYLEQRSPDQLRVDLLKVGHHGSKSSTSMGFLAAIDPSLALISAGRGNRYGHPAAEVVTRLQDRGVKLWSTSRSGALTVEFPLHGPIRLLPP